MRARSTLAAWIAAALVAGCGDDDAGTPDAGAPDASALDAGTDAGRADTGPPPPSRAADAPLVQWVDPFIGTAGLGYSVGSAFPGPQTPYGMVRPGPDSQDESGAPGFSHCAGYRYDDPYLASFSLTRMHGTGITDYGTLGIMPMRAMSAEQTTTRERRQRYDKAEERASPGYYRTRADGITSELTATDHVGVFRFTFPAGSPAVVAFDVGHAMSASVSISDGRISVDLAASELTGFVRFVGGYSGRFGGMPVYFTARFRTPFARYGVWQAGTLAPGEDARAGADTGAWVEWDATAPREIELAVGISFVDEAHSRMNLDAEATAADTFDSVRTATEARWERELGRIEIEGRAEHDFRMYYTALYHTLLMPTLAMDVDGSYRGLDAAVHTATGYRYYTDFSLWDTFRTLHPFLTLAYPEYQRDFLRSLTAMAVDGGYMPRWPLGIGYTGGMLGESATVVFADSWVKGVRDFDLRAAYDAMRRTAMAPTPPGSPYDGRAAVADYIALGYVPMDRAGASVSWTLESAYDDHALALLADALGETADRDTFAARAGNWRNVWDPARMFMVGRAADGTFDPMLNIMVWEDYYAEGNAWQYVFYVPHDLEGLATLSGGAPAMLDRLQELFVRSARVPRGIGPDPFYWQGNEPDLHYAFMFSAFDDADRTADWSRWILGARYDETPGGLPGNDDAGTMSAWLLFAASGFYSIAGESYYLVASPTMTRVTMHLPGGDFVVSAPDASDAARYVRRATLDGRELARARFEHAEIAAGAEIVLEMAPEPVGWPGR